MIEVRWAVETRGKIAFRGDENADPRRRMVVCAPSRVRQESMGETFTEDTAYVLDLREDDFVFESEH